MSISWAKHNAKISASVTSATSTNASSGYCDRAATASALASLRGGRPVAATRRAMGTASGAATAKLATKAKITKPPNNPLNIVIMNPNFKEDCWGTYKFHCVSMKGR